MRHFSFRPALTLKGRKFKGLRGFAGKPFHPPLTDVPVGAYTIAPLLDIAAAVLPTEWRAAELYDAAGYVYLAGLIFSVPTMLTGLYDWFNTKAGTQIRRMANAHAWTMIVMSLAVIAALALRYLGTDRPTPSLAVVVLGVIVLALMVVGGTIGGSMTYDFGFNVETSTDNPVYHPHERDIIHPHDPAPESESA